MGGWVGGVALEHKGEQNKDPGCVCVYGGGWDGGVRVCVHASVRVTAGVGKTPGNGGDPDPDPGPDGHQDHRKVRLPKRLLKGCHHVMYGGGAVPR